MSFSQRKGYRKIKEIQFESIDNELKNRLWNLIWRSYLKEGGRDVLTEEEIRYFFEPLWEEHFKLPIDEYSRYSNSLEVYLRHFRERYFDKKNQWYDYYDLLEFIVGNNSISGFQRFNQDFKSECNTLLESERSGYRFVDGRICSITSREEISEIEKALNSPFDAVQTHIQKALDLFASRQNPSYRNSIKESISAVEAMCELIVKNKTTLSKALDQIERKGSIALPMPLKQAFDKLYGFTSSSQGIRHSLGLTEEANLTEDDARFFLIACSAFVNYLTNKASAAGISS